MRTAVCCVNATCGRPLSAYEAREGYTRCRLCRGLVGQAHPFNATLVAVKPPPPLTSWWTAARRERFTDQARAHTVPKVSD